MLRVLLIWESILKWHYQLSIINFIPDNYFSPLCLFFANTLGVFYAAVCMHSNFCWMHIYVYRNNKTYPCCYWWWRPSASIIIGKCSLHVLLTSRPGSPSFPCQRTTVAGLVFLGFMNRLLFSLRLPGHATLVLELLHQCEKDLISITHFPSH